MSDGHNNIIIIKKKHKGHGGHHGGAWKVAYADFVTAMMALFIVLWVLGQDEKIVQSVAGYFKDPIGFSIKSKSILPGEGSSPLNLNTPESTPSFEEIKKQELERLKAMAEKIKSELAASPEFESLKDQIKIEIIDEGLRIEMLESNDDVFFEIGTSHLKPLAERLITKIGANLATLPNKIVVEGHTDSRPFLSGSSFYGNYELSADRANAARRVLAKSGMSKEQIDEVRGYADARLLDPNDPYSLVNRRISIIIKFTHK